MRTRCVCDVSLLGSSDLSVCWVPVPLPPYVKSRSSRLGEFSLEVASETGAVGFRPQIALSHSE